MIEKRRFLENNSARNTGKVSALHGAFYHTLPADIAQSVYQLNRTAVDHYEQLIRTADIACHWQRTSAVLAAQSEEGAAILNQEKAARVSSRSPAERSAKLSPAADLGRSAGHGRSGAARSLVVPGWFIGSVKRQSDALRRIAGRRDSGSLPDQRRQLPPAGGLREGFNSHHAVPGL